MDQRQRTDETRQVEAVLRPHFTEVHAWRFNQASIRVSIVDKQFEGLKRGKRVALVEPYIATLPDETQSRMVVMFLLTPKELPRAHSTLYEFDED